MTGTKPLQVQSRIATGVRSGHKVELRDAPEPFFKQDAQFPPRERRAQTNVDATDKGEVTAMSSIIPVTTARMLPCILLKARGRKEWGEEQAVLTMFRRVDGERDGAEGFTVPRRIS